jgi:hypothetical protein
MARIEILYFLEDIAQEGMVKALVARVFSEYSISEKSLHQSVRSSRGGSRGLLDFEEFMKDTQEARSTDIDLLVVANDGNCKGYNQKLKDLSSQVAEIHPFKTKVVFAIPDPHIERWYLLDQKAFKAGVGVLAAPELPVYKCDKNYYKHLLHQFLSDSGIKTLLGGTEYAESIVAKIENFDSLQNRDIGFDNFIKELRSSCKRIIRH